MKRPRSDGLQRRYQTLVEYAKWTALSPLRAGSPIRASNTGYPLLNGVAFAEVLCGATGEFNEWHERQTVALCDRARWHLPNTWTASHGRELPVGASAKLINVFLKSPVYTGRIGGAGLRAALHPPARRRPPNGLKRRFRDCPDILQKVTFGATTDIRGDQGHPDLREVPNRDRGGAAPLQCFGCSLLAWGSVSWPSPAATYANANGVPEDDPSSNQLRNVSYACAARLPTTPPRRRFPILRNPAGVGGVGTFRSPCRQRAGRAPAGPLTPIVRNPRERLPPTAGSSGPNSTPPRIPRA